MRTFVASFRLFIIKLFIMEPFMLSIGAGIANTGIQALMKSAETDAEKQWWYEQQRFLEQHNSPAFRSNQFRQAGLNPYTETSAVPLGNVDSSLPRMPSSTTFDVNAIQNSLLVNAQRENIEQDTQTKKSVEGLNYEKIATESEWRSQIIQNTLNLKQEYELGLITKEDAELRLQEYKDALSRGYNSFLIDMDLKESNRLLNESLATLYDKEGKKVDQETLLTSVKYASASLQYSLDLIYSELEREAALTGVDLNNSFTRAELDEFMDTQEVRVSLLNVQKSFAKLAVDEATRQDALNKITNEKDKLIAEQMLDAVKNGEGLDYWILNMMEKDPGAFLNSMTNIITSIAPNVNYNRSSSLVTRKTAK